MSIHPRHSTAARIAQAALRLEAEGETELAAHTRALGQRHARALFEAAEPPADAGKLTVDSKPERDSQT